MASAKLPLSLLFFFAGLGITSSTTHPGDTAVLLHLRNVWKNTPPNWADSEDPCGLPWEGIECNNSRVILVKLASMGLEGNLVSEIGQLTELHCLDLSFNRNLSGPIPSSIGNMKMLKMLCLCAINLGGTIPPEIVNLHMLDFLALNSNNLTGEIPANIGQLSNLNWLDLGNNNLNGTLPLSSNNTLGLDNLSRATHINLGQNQLSGTIPERFFHPNMSLRNVLLAGNYFTGPIPSSVGVLPNLQILRLDRNAITGTVPLSVLSLPQLRDLNLARNGLTGDIPNISGITTLAYLDLSYNVFTSSLAPPWFFRHPNLSVVLMEYVGLMGELPTDIFRAPRLKQLYLRNNKVNGTVDLSAAGTSDLQFLDLQSNIIIGVENEPPSINTTIALYGNPVCNSLSREKIFCQLNPDPNTYFTNTLCTNECPPGERSRPNDCQCGQPYSGEIIFHSPSFRDLRNATRFQKLERGLQDALMLGNNCVSLKKSYFGPNDDYLHIPVDFFPTEKEYFNRTRIRKLGFALGSQIWVPDREWGPYLFVADPYNFERRVEEPKFSAAVVAGIASCSVTLFIGVLVLGIYAMREKRKADRARRAANPFENWATDDKEAGSAPQLNGVSFFSISDVNRCTDNFSENNKIGVGGYGQVYQGKLPNGQFVAIKRAKQGSKQGALEFKTEIELLSRVHHMNLVRLVGFCYEKGEQMLIYEYVSNGTLAEMLSGKMGFQVSWIERLRIALGSARGLAYLHELADPPIIHRDVKSANILLDENLRPKVADFGMSSVVENGDSENGPIAIKGTLGYLDPEYFETMQLTDRSDVYSFGVVMLELLTGKKAIEKGSFIVHKVRSTILTPNGRKEVVDPAISSESILVGLERFVDLAMRCVEHYAVDRPTMREVVKEIESILETDGLDSRSSSMAASVRNMRIAGGHRRYSGSASSLEMSSNAFHSSAAGYMLPTTLEPK